MNITQEKIKIGDKVEVVGLRIRRGEIGTVVKTDCNDWGGLNFQVEFRDKGDYGTHYKAEELLKR